MKKVKLISFLILFVYLAGCKSTDRVGLQLMEYVNQDMIAIAQVETRALEYYGAVTGVNYTTDEAVQTALQDHVVPLYKRFLHLLRNIKPGSDSVSRLHAIYVGGAETMYDGFKSKMLGIKKKDPALIQTANRKIEHGRMDMERWRDELLKLYELHHVKYEKK